jgi:hypothetical protein
LRVITPKKRPVITTTVITTTVITTTVITIKQKFLDYAKYIIRRDT